MFDISFLRCFVAVAEEMHFGRAAERMNMSQPPFSRQIQILEHILDVQLLQRSSRSVKLTPAGQTFLPEARHILQLLDNATLLTKRMALGKTGSLKIGFTAMTAVGVLPRLVAGFREKFPNAELRLQEAGSAEQLRKLHSSDIDIAIVRPPLPQTSLQSLCLSSEPLIAAIPATHTLAAKSKIALRDFHGQPFISYLPYEAYYLYTMVGDLLATADVTPNCVQQLTQVHAVIALVHSGIGLSIVPEGARLFNFTNVVLRPIADPQPKPLELLMAWRDDNLNPLVPQMAELARGIISADK
ncbi:MAG TPA: LysR family transcriptional regulator [Rhizomicrobium sp.]|nr:LysR family transcriptional regulator [Rhizomicrobium sp.]